MSRRRTTRHIHEKYRAQTPITMVTCYDYSFARLVAQADIDAILVGDSLGNVVQGHDTTLPVTVDDIIYHTKAIMRGNATAHVLADMPFMSYQASLEEGLRNAGRLVKEGGAQAVKIEGGASYAELVEKLVASGIPVCGHLGLTPQSVHAFGGYRVQARSEAAGQKLLNDARALEQAGAYMLVLEMVPKTLAEQVTQTLSIPTIGIGAGPVTSGQVLVLYDLLGLNLEFQPKFLKRYAQLETTVCEALSAYREEVEARTFPSDDHSW